MGALAVKPRCIGPDPQVLRPALVGDVRLSEPLASLALALTHVTVTDARHRPRSVPGGSIGY
jgi:hypothetical protein